MGNNNFRVVAFITSTFAAICWCVNPADLHAQTVSGTILGLVQDQQ